MRFTVGNLKILHSFDDRQEIDYFFRSIEFKR